MKNGLDVRNKGTNVLENTDKNFGWFPVSEELCKNSNTNTPISHIFTEMWASELWEYCYFIMYEEMIS